MRAAFSYLSVHYTNRCNILLKYMELPNNWIFPIAILPGIALLILSAANLSNALTEELNHWLTKKHNQAEIMARRKILQLKRLHRAMITLYVGAGCFVLSALLGSHIPVISQKTANLLATASLCIGIVVILCSFYFLIRYSIKAVHIKEEYFKQIFSTSVDDD